MSLQRRSCYAALFAVLLLAWYSSVAFARTVRCLYTQLLFVMVDINATTLQRSTAHRGSSKHIYEGPVRGTSIALEALAARGECLVLSAAAVGSLSDAPCTEFAMR
jgi:hypothetical protein